MNPINFFKFLEKEKGKPIPLKIKLIHGLPLTPEELDIKGNLYLFRKPITSLPQGLKVKGALEISHTKITSLPPGLKIGEDLDLSFTQITSLPPDLKVEGNIWVSQTPLAEKSYEEIRAMIKTGYIKGFIYK